MWGCAVLPIANYFPLSRHDISVHRSRSRLDMVGWPSGTGHVTRPGPCSSMTESMGKTGITSIVKSTTESVSLMPNGLDRNGHGMVRWLLVVLLVTILTCHNTSGQLLITCSLFTIIGVSQTWPKPLCVQQGTWREVYFLVQWSVTNRRGVVACTNIA
jgi:hypothetical protein